MNTSSQANMGPAREYFRPLLKLTVVSLLAFPGFSCGFILMLFFGFLSLITDTAGDYPLWENVLGMAVLAFIYGVLFLIALAVPFFVIAFVLAFVVWKLKLLEWWACSTIGGLATSLPMLIILIPVTLGFFLHPPNWRDVLDVFGMYLASVSCGGIGGLSLWIALRLMGFRSQG